MSGVVELSPAEAEARMGELAGLLHACVLGGASVSFVLPFPLAEAEAFWRRKVLPAMHEGGRVLLAALVDGHVAGTVQLGLDMPPNQPHRAEVSKLLVHPAHRRRGLARALMTALEARARAEGRRLITLDTRTGDAAEPLYAALGYEVAGIIPDYCRDTVSDRLDPTTIMFRRL